jgi:hypothetical protein
MSGAADSTGAEDEGSWEAREAKKAFLVDTTAKLATLYRDSASSELPRGLHASPIIASQPSNTS